MLFPTEPDKEQVVITLHGVVFVSRPMEPALAKVTKEALEKTHPYHVISIFKHEG
jgi:hypothetical protein